MQGKTVRVIDPDPTVTLAIPLRQRHGLWLSVNDLNRDIDRRCDDWAKRTGRSHSQNIQLELSGHQTAEGSSRSLVHGMM